MIEEFGTFLRTLRRERGLSQERLAIQSGVALRTLKNWEAGRHSPSSVEIKRVLRSLEVTSWERSLAVELLTTPRGLQMARQNAETHSNLTQDLGSLPNLGDLQRAMRVRCQWTQEQLAEALGVTRTTVVRWETTRNLPSAESLDRLCTLLHAAPEEKQALQTRRLLPPHWKSILTLEECEEELQHIYHFLNDVPSPVIELTLLALKRQLWLLAPRSSEAVRLLVFVETEHASWLNIQNRKVEAETLVWRGLNLAIRHCAPERSWLYGVNLATHLCVARSHSEKVAVPMLRKWLRILPPVLHNTLWCDMALYAARTGQHDMAHTFFDQARDTFETTLGRSAHEDDYFCLTRARALLHMRRPLEAMDWLPEPEGVISFQIFALLLWGEAALTAGDKVEAERNFRRAQTLLTEFPQPARQTRLEELMQQLG